MDKLNSGRDISHSDVLSHNLLGCAAWKYKGTILFLKGIMH